MEDKPKATKTGISARAPVKSETSKNHPHGTRKDFAKDINTFEELPDKKKEAHRLKDQVERSIGPENVKLNKTIQEKSE